MRVLATTSARFTILGTPTAILDRVWHHDVLASTQYREQVLGEGNRPWRPSQALLAAILEEAIKEIQYGDHEAYCWARGDFDADLRDEGRFRLCDIVAYLNLSTTTKAIRSRLLAMFGCRGFHAPQRVAWQRRPYKRWRWKGWHKRSR